MTVSRYETARGRWRGTSFTEPDREYTVALATDERTYGFSRPAWRSARAPKPGCKHIEAIRCGQRETPAVVRAAVPTAPISQPVPVTVTTRHGRFSILEFG